MNYMSIIDKVVYISSSNKYKIYFTTKDHKYKSYFNIPISDAKNIVLAKENIYSEKLKTYNFIAELLAFLSINVDRFIVTQKNNILVSKFYFIINKKEYSIDISFVDAIILSILTFGDMYIHEDLYKQSKTIKILQNCNNNDLNKLNNLRNILKLLIDSEEYESAALIRNKINQLDKRIN
tara:strand:+ start:80 stop:619 length:540 start_codon:yes stop_codon:yes gene_type:complete